VRWARIDGSERGQRGASIAALRAAVAAQAILSFDAQAAVPRDLAGRARGVQELTGRTTRRSRCRKRGRRRAREIENGGLPQMRYAR